MSEDYENSDGDPAVECTSCNLLSWTVADWNRRVDAAALALAGKRWIPEPMRVRAQQPAEE